MPMWWQLMQAFWAVSAMSSEACMSWQLPQVTVSWSAFSGRSCGFTTVPLLSVSSVLDEVCSASVS